MSATRARGCGWLFLSFLSLACARPVPSAIVDQVGNPVPPGGSSRIVALAPDVTELAFAVGAGAALVAVPATADFPPEAARLPRVNPNDLEAIVALAPDLVLATTAGNDPRVVERSRALAIRVCTFDVTSLDRLVAAAELAGHVTGNPGRGAALAAELAGRIARARARGAALPSGRALYVVWWEPLIVAAPGTVHHDLLRAAALDNLAPAAAGRYPRLDPEVLLDPRLDVVVCADEPDVRGGFELVRRHAAGTRMASGSTRVIWLPADSASRPSPRMVEALDVLLSARERAQ